MVKRKRASKRASTGRKRKTPRRRIGVTSFMRAALPPMSRKRLRATPSSRTRGDRIVVPVGPYPYVYPWHPLYHTPSINIWNPRNPAADAAPAPAAAAAPAADAAAGAAPPRRIIAGNLGAAGAIPEGERGAPAGLPGVGRGGDPGPAGARQRRAKRRRPKRR